MQTSKQEECGCEGKKYNVAKAVIWVYRGLVLLGVPTCEALMQ